MHEGDHSILDHDHAHHSTRPNRKDRTNRLIAAVVVAAAVVLFLALRFLAGRLP
jgi:hypothetical protein